MNDARCRPIEHRRTTAQRRAGLALAALFAVVTPTSHAAQSGAQIFRCVDADGHVVFSDTNCGSTSQKVEIVESSAGLSSIGGNGLSEQEKGALGALDAREAQIASERAAAGGGGSAPAAGSPASAPAPRRSY